MHLLVLYWKHLILYYACRIVFFMLEVNGSRGQANERNFTYALLFSRDINLEQIFYNGYMLKEEISLPSSIPVSLLDLLKNFYF